MDDLLEEGPLPEQDVLGVSRLLASGDLHAQRHLEGEADLPGAEVVVEAGIRDQAGGPLPGRDHRFEGLDRGPGHDGLGVVELLAQAVELVEHVQVQLRQQLVPGDQELKLGDPDEQSAAGRCRAGSVSIWARLDVPVGLEPGLGRRA